MSYSICRGVVKVAGKRLELSLELFRPRMGNTVTRVVHR
jgi:hypothetical protein